MLFKSLKLLQMFVERQGASKVKAMVNYGYTVLLRICLECLLCLCALCQINKTTTTTTTTS